MLLQYGSLQYSTTVCVQLYCVLTVAMYRQFSLNSSYRRCGYTENYNVARFDPTLRAPLVLATAPPSSSREPDSTKAMSWASPFRFESRPGSRASTAGTGARRSVPPTPTFDYDYARSPTPAYQRGRGLVEEVVLDGAFVGKTRARKQKKKKKKNMKNMKNMKNRGKGRSKKGNQKSRAMRDLTDFDDPMTQGSSRPRAGRAQIRIIQTM